MNGQRLPRASDPSGQYVVTGSVWNRTMDVIEYCARLMVGRGLKLSDTTGGRVLTLATPPSRPPLLQVTGAASTPGLYLAVVWERPDTPIPTAAATLGPDSLGASGRSCYFLHLAEVGLDTHLITHPDNVFSTMVRGWLSPQKADDGLDVYEGVAPVLQLCTTGG